MIKPTLFFSHSSKDKDAILLLKNKLEKATGGVLNIFMSSDGQSIPFGTNWIHKIEDGLQQAKIMFVFVTENSVSSGWIYFEAGFAYSKGIQVIPVGIGIDIGGLKPPLNMLQGFNIISEDSLNNFISVVNVVFDYQFEESFTQVDYTQFSQSIFPVYSRSDIAFDDLISCAEYDVHSEYSTNTGEKKTRNISAYFTHIKDFLDSDNIPYSLNQLQGNRYITLVVKGIKIIYREEKQSVTTPHRNPDDAAEISFRISPHNFSESFELLNKLMALSDDQSQTRYIALRINDSFQCAIEDEENSAILSAHRDYSVIKNRSSGYINELLGLKFYIFDNNRFFRDTKPEHTISVVYDYGITDAGSIIQLVQNLYAVRIIRKKK